jgi:hypothetical protein
VQNLLAWRRSALDNSRNEEGAAYLTPITWCRPWQLEITPLPKDEIAAARSE